MLDQYFEKKKRLFPQYVKGKFRKIKSVLNIIFFSIFVFSPFIRYDRGVNIPNQAILIDIENSRAYFFMIEIWPQEVYYLMGILIFAAVILFFVTSLFGRVWCGYACFQTVWTDIFIFIEKIFQGDRNDRIILDRKNNFKKFYKKFLTHISWIIVSIMTGFIFTCYFNDSINLLKQIFDLKISYNVGLWILGIAGSTYVMAGFAREHVCTFMCPYARFQSAMFDSDTLIISYDEKRGEPRSKKKHEEITNSANGDCIDCKQCVVVCPQGIDIRNGLQMECIACGLCIDACDNIMTKIGLPKGLIRYDTERNLKNPRPENKFRILRLRTIYYVAILSIVAFVMGHSLVTKSVLEVNAIPDRNPIFVKLSDGSIRNGYVIKISNKSHQDKSFSIKIDDSLGLTKIYSSQVPDLTDFKVKASEVGAFKIYLIVAKEFIDKNSEDRMIFDAVISDNEGGNEVKTNLVFIAK